MCSIAEDQSLPVDFNGTSLQLSSPMDSTMHDPLASHLSTDMESPGMFPNLTSVGGVSPHRVRTMKDQEQQLAELRKDNFGLKLRIYHLEEALTKKWGDKSEGWQLNIELQVQMDNIKKELAEKDALIIQAKSAINAMAAKHAQELNELRQAVSTADGIQALEERLEDKEAELEDAQRQSEEANARANEMQQLNEQLEGEMREKDREMADMQRELGDMRGELAEAIKAVPARPHTHNVRVQTTEPVMDRAEAERLQTQLADTAARLQESERAVLELRDEVGERAGRVKELDVELLTASQKLAAGAGIHAHQMSEQAAQLDKCKANLRDAEAELRRQEAELGERERECRERQREVEGAQQRARQAEERASELEPRARAAEREAKDLRRQLREAQAQVDEEAANRARDLRDVEGRLREAEERLGRSHPEMAARKREVEDMARTLREREEEISQLKSQLRDREEDVSRARRATHAANMERQEQARALGELREELGALRDQMQQQQANVQQNADAALAAKDSIIGQLKKELKDLQAKLAEADDRLLHLTTSKAAELGVLQGTADDLSQQLEQSEGQLHALRKDVGQLTGEKAALQREVNKLRAHNEATQEQLAGLESELAAKTSQLQAAHQAMADLQKLVKELQRAQPSREHMEREAAEKARLKSQLASLRSALANKEEEARQLGETLGIKDGTIRDLQQQLEQAEEERDREAERAGDLQREKSELQSEVAGLQSQGRIAQLSADDLQARLTDAYREREEVARKLRQAEEALGNKDSSYERARKACEALQRQVAQLQQQVVALSQRPSTTSVGVSTSSPGRQDSGVMAGGVDESVGTSPPTAQGGVTGGGPSSTTMIFGSLSEDLLKMILQRLQEIYAEILTNRTTGTEASSSLSSKMEHLADLQRHLEACFQDSQSNAADNKPASGNTSYTAYYFMRGEDGEPLVADGDNEEEGEGGRTPPKRSSTPKKSSPKTPPKFREHFSKDEPLESVPRETQAQISALQSELEEVKRWNDALQTRLKKSGGTRDAGVGMEKGAKVNPPQSVSFAQEKYLELEAEVDRLLGELEAEKEHSQAEREQQENERAALQGELSAASERVGELEQQLREAVMRDAATTTAETATLGEEVEALRQEVGEAEATIARLKGWLQAERDDNQRLRSEVAEMKQERLRQSPARSTAATASMPNLLLTPDRTPGKKTSDSWTSPGITVGSQGDGLDMRALKERHEEVTRLNQELQRKCCEQLHKSPPSASGATATSGNAAHPTASWQGREQEEQSLRAESLGRERSLLTQLRQSEGRCAEKEAEWRERERELRRQAAELEAKLGQCGHDCEALRRKLTESLATCREKDEERINLTRSLSQSTERIRDLEQQLEQLLASKSTAIQQLEEQQAARERELHTARERAEELARTVESLERAHEEEEEEEEEEERELETLRESVDSLSQQLTSALEELEGMQRKNSGLEERRNLLHSQLSSCQEQVATLQAELQLYQKLLQDSGKSAGVGPSGSAGSSVTSGRLMQLLEEVRRLREQLNQGVRNSNALAEQLRSKMDTQEGPSFTMHSLSGSQLRGEEVVPQRSEGTQTTPTHTQPDHTRLQTTYSWSCRPGEQQTHTPTANQSYAATLPRTHLTTAPQTGAKLSLGSIGTLTVKADVQMSDASTTSLPQSTQHTRPPRTAEPSLLLSAPRNQSSPFVKGAGQQSSHASLPLERGRTGKETITKPFDTRGTGVHRSTHITGNKGSAKDFRQQPSLGDYLTREGVPKLEPAVGSLHSLHSHQSSSSSVSGGGHHSSSTAAAATSAARQTASSTTQTTSHPPQASVLPGGVGGEFESLESRLQQALESSTLQGADRLFLEELLLYLRQQRRQLDESWRLLENMERQNQQGVGGASRVNVETAQSGTIPTSATGREGGQGRGGGRVGSTGVDLSSLYEHLLKTQASLIEAKTNLNSRQKHT